MFSSIVFSLPSRDFFQLPPRDDPITLLPPASGSSASAPPFDIPVDIYEGALNIYVPITIAVTYATTAILLNKYNKSTGNRPWAISQTRLFFAFVVLHNVFLAVYSGWTFLGMFFALKTTVKSWSNSAGGFSATVDSLCKMHGASGLGSAITYDTLTSQWVSQSPASALLTNTGIPSPANSGRLWTEGLAFYGWIFYISKFYEVLDTFIILAKGKGSSTLQTYHHAGAMLCMWAGIRYMSPPIWLFAFLNSFIHTLMYTYYTLTAFNVPISQRLKRSLTTLQIVQFLVGTSYAAVHSFISYKVPVQVPYLESIVKAASSAVSQKTITTSTSTTVAALASAAGLNNSTFSDLMKKLLVRAAGGVAAGAAAVPEDNVVVPKKTAAETLVESTTKYKTEYQTVPCIDTSGQTFAIWLNVLYLAPLTVLFVRFFIRSYIRRTSVKPRVQKHTLIKAVDKASEDAAHGIERKLKGNGFANANGNGVANGHA